MPQPLTVPLPPRISLWDSCVLRVAAIDPTDGSIVTGVTVSDVTIECTDVRGNLPDIGNPLLIGIGGNVQAVAGIDWTIVIASAIPTVPATLAVLISNVNRRSLRTPSGDPIGHVVERTHDLAAVSAAGITMTTQPAMVRSAERLEADENSPLKVDGDPMEIKIPKEEQ